MPAGCESAKGRRMETYPAAELEEDPERRQDDGEDDVDAGRRAVRHLLDRSLLSLPPIE